MEEKALGHHRFGISGSTLKIIAVISMLIDHIGAAFLGRMLVGFDMLPDLLGDSILLKLFPWMLDWNKLVRVYYVTRYIGRIAFPIYCFLLVEGFGRTRNVKKYALRLGIFALVSEIPFDLCFKASFLEFSYQNIFFTLLIGLLAMMAADWCRVRRWCENPVADRTCRYLLMALSAAAGVVAAQLLATDYAGTGVICIMVLYLFRNRRIPQAIAGAVTFSWEVTAPLAFLPILAYNGKRGLSLKYFFYGFYPLHLLLIYLLCAAIGIGGISPV